METNLELAEKILKEQEAGLVFDSFCNEDAWELGKLMVEEVHRRGIDLSISIRKLNGYIVFQYVTEGTPLDNQLWMERKYHIVCNTRSSSMLGTVTALRSGRWPEDDFMLGGGFPIRVKDKGIVMVLTVSSLPHEQDHAFMIDCLEKYLGRKVPPLDMEIPMLNTRA